MPKPRKALISLEATAARSRAATAGRSGRDRARATHLGELAHALPQQAHRAQGQQGGRLHREVLGKPVPVLRVQRCSRSKLCSPFLRMSA